MMWWFLRWIDRILNHPLGYIIGGTLLGALIFGHPLTIKNFLVAAIVYGMGRYVVLPFYHVIICNYRKVPYHGEAGTDQRG